MFRPYVTDLPARKDLSFRTNSDKTWGVAWGKTDGSPVPVMSAICTLEFDVAYPTDLEPVPTPVRHVIDSTDPGDSAGFIDADRYPDGVVLVTLPAGAWITLDGRSGNWDIQAVSDEGVVRVLERGIFTVEEGQT